MINFDPVVDLYGPSGNIINSDGDSSVAEINRTLTESGTYTLVASASTGCNVETGNYDLYFVKAPGANEDGQLLNGGVINGLIDLGDLDSYTFVGDVGESIQIRMADTDGTYFDPVVDLYGPSGNIINSDGDSSVAEINRTLTESGTYTLVASASTGCNVETGNYFIEFDSFRLGSIMVREKIAKPILRAIYGNLFIPATATGTVYSDVQPGDFNADWIEELFDTGISEGCLTNYYCPDMVVTKEQLAKILLKAKHGSTYVPPVASGSLFTDVSSGSFDVDWIEALSTEGITERCDATNFCPKEAVTVEGFENMLNKALP